VDERLKGQTGRLEIEEEQSKKAGDEGLGIETAHLIGYYDILRRPKQVQVVCKLKRNDRTKAKGRGKDGRTDDFELPSFVRRVRL
jgi:hypothetical protein